MLYSTFCKLKVEAENEAETVASKQPEVVVDEGTFTAYSYITVGNLLTV
jgi:hypothetical protein